MTQATWDIVHALCAERMRNQRCKGTCIEKRPDIAFPDKAAVDACVVRCMKVLLDSGVYHGINATPEHAAHRAPAT